MKIIIRENKEYYKCTKEEIKFLESISNERIKVHAFRVMRIKAEIINKNKKIIERLQIGL